MYTQAVYDHLTNVRNLGPPEGVTHDGLSGTPGDGPWIRVYMKIVGSKIEKAGYNCYGCPAAVASASALAELLAGKQVKEAQTLTAGEILRALGGLPEGKQERPEMAIEALRRALAGVAEQ